MEILLIVGLLLVERLRLDLPVRRWCAQVVPSPVLALGLGWPVPVPMSLAGFDLRRLVPRVLTVLAVVLLLRTLSADPPIDAYDGVNQTIGFAWAMLGLFVLVLVASIGGRDREYEALAALPAGPRARIHGIALTLVAAALAVYALGSLRLLQLRGHSYDTLLPDPWELTQPALMVLGGGLLGLLVARLVPAWVAVPVAAVAAIVWTGAVGSSDHWPMLSPLLEWVRYDGGNSAARLLEPGSLAWHNAYLLGLCGLGLVAALLREPGSRRGLVLLGVGLTAGTVVAAVLALP